MTKLDKNKPLLFLGDTHGNWRNLFPALNRPQFKNSYLVCVGDCGIGFKNKQEQLEELVELDAQFKSRGITFLTIRGNHDDPGYFKKACPVPLLDNFKLVEDYTIMQYGDKLIQFIGGAISVDRSGRKEGTSYWKDEGVEFKKNKCKKVDILVTHTAPTFCYPSGFNHIVNGWAEVDKTLKKELTKERELLDKICGICLPSLHLYGHFHLTWTEKLGDCNHVLLNINEIYS
jgi:DNA repair exonuclease SbcCD nuclease subunit